MIENNLRGVLQRLKKDTIFKASEKTLFARGSNGAETCNRRSQVFGAHDAILFVSHGAQKSTIQKL